MMGLDYAANQSGCLVGYLAAEMAKMRAHKNVIGAVGGLHIPPVDIWIAGYKFCAKLYKQNIKVLVGYSGDFVKSDLCKTVAENQIAQGSYVEFQVAGGCGLGTLKAAAAHKIWGIGVDKDQYKDAERVLTSGVKKVDLGIFNVDQDDQGRQVQGQPRPAVHAEERRHERRQDQPGRAEEVHPHDEPDQGARSSPASSRSR